ncbi:histone deacetylase Hda1 [Penicillium taxi]|uniref:histone deacetylase Hda1 n=1 Tax=Penicillium taxi TaxID=168475 RepID=UPI002545563E|nr:histone deacetylase Hda1 [Penicillium taxi]KAJ5908684.1 histone deacetylase Hda1 [Penicillium taxi]
MEGAEDAIMGEDNNSHSLPMIGPHVALEQTHVEHTTRPVLASSAENEMNFDSTISHPDLETLPRRHSNSPLPSLKLATTVNPAGLTFQDPPQQLLTIANPPPHHNNRLLLSVTQEDKRYNLSIPSREESASDSMEDPTSDWSEDHQPSGPHKALANKPTGLCYDVQMRFHCELRPSSDAHPEDPRRIASIYDALCKAGLVKDSSVPEQYLASVQLVDIPVRKATEKEIIKIHDKAHFDFVKDTPNMSESELLRLERDRDSIYFNRFTYQSALLSAGGAIETCLAVARGTVKNAIAVIRPPGHHAEHDTAMGFCIFNNVCIAARACQAELGDKCRKILILDWDVHHGNGIQKAFYDDPNVLYISLHVYKNATFYPSDPIADMDHCGEGPGVGRNVNIPWPDQGMGDGDYMLAFQRVVMPIAMEFNPDLVIVAAGFDAAAGDLLGGCHVNPPCYAHMTNMLMSLANGKVAVCLEGGYNLKSIEKAALSVTKALMGDPPDRLRTTKPTDAAVTTINRVMAAQAPYWQCMYPKRSDPPPWADRLHDVIRQAQSKSLFNKFKLIPLPIYREDISTSFSNQVLASPNYRDAVPIVVIFHDPPEIMGIPDPANNKLEAHNCWVADPISDYIGWIVGKGYAVIDVNIPKHITRERSASKYMSEDEDRPTSTELLASYLWDNYIESMDTPEIFFVGVGNSFYGVANLLINRDNLYKRINGVVSFVAENPVRAIASPTQTWLSKWYRENSLIFVSHEHGIWHQDRKAPSKRYGLLRQSPQALLGSMLKEHKEEVFAWISERADPDEDGSGDEDMEG